MARLLSFRAVAVTAALSLILLALGRRLQTGGNHA
jgi:hypothetical protein